MAPTAPVWCLSALTSMLSSSDTFPGRPSRFSLMGRKILGLGGGRGPVALSATPVADAVTGGFSRPGLGWWRPSMIASYRSLSSGCGWYGHSRRVCGHTPPAKGLTRPPGH